jgi:hypothetical protein
MAEGADHIAVLGELRRVLGLGYEGKEEPGQNEASLAAVEEHVTWLEVAMGDAVIV